MKRDDAIRWAVRDAIDSEPRLAGSAIEIAVRDGMVTLSGLVKDEPARAAAEQAVRRVAGVRALTQQLETASRNDAAADSELADQVSTVIAWCVGEATGAVACEARNGWVRLTGEVSWPSQRDDLERNVRRVPGVRAISNHVRVARSAETQGPRLARGWP